MLFHGLQHCHGRLDSFHENGAEFPLARHSVTWAINVEINFIVSVLLFDRLRGPATQVCIVATNLANNGMSVGIESQPHVQVIRMSNGFVDHHFGPQDAPGGHDAKQLSEFSIRNIEHGSNVELFLGTACACYSCSLNN
jgi:hypothetical protein